MTHEKAVDIFQVGDWVQITLSETPANGCMGVICDKSPLYVNVRVYTGPLADKTVMIEYASTLRHIPIPAGGHLPENVHVAQELPT